MSDAALLNAFESFANFGSSKLQLNEETTMDNARFAKMARECKIIGDALTSVDVDIIYKKARVPAI
jgi:hypothetical protein